MSLSSIEAVDRSAGCSDNFGGAVVDTCRLLAFDGLSSNAEVRCIGAASRVVAKGRDASVSVANL